MYVTQGSGIFWNCGTSLRARNKVAAALQLTEQLAPLFSRDKVRGTQLIVSTLLELLLDLAAEHSLPLALKVGAVRGANPALRSGGDGVEVADLSFVRTLCVRYPHVKFLLTVLSNDNQHELAVLGRKFGNLHVYGW